MGTQVDIEIVPKAHALLSASSAERWITCTPSARIEEALPDRGSSYASDGTAAHAFAELRLRWLFKQITKEEYHAGYDATHKLHADAVADWTVADWEAITSYVEYVVSETERLEADEVIIEARVDYSRFAQSGFGTSDALLISRKQKVVKSIDLKFGKGVPVSARKNTQARLYALGGLMAADPQNSGVFENVEWTIHQPRLDYVGTDGESVGELIDWAKNVVAPAAKLAWEGKGKLVPSAKGCQFCKAAATCRARTAENVLIAMRDFDMTIDLDDFLMDPKEVARILPQLAQWKAWASKMEEYALVQARDKGVEIPGYKLVRGRANRAWKPEVDVVDELRSIGIDDKIIFPPPAPPAPRSVAQMEKEIGKAKFAPIEIALVHKPAGTPALVPEEDPRPAIDKVGDARQQFDLNK